MPRPLLSGLALLALSACRIDPTPGPSFTGSDETDEPGSPAMPSDPSGGHGGASATARGGGGSSSPPGAGDGAGGSEDEPPPGACDAQSVSLDEVRSGVVLSGITIALVATATSQKFLVSETESGNCLWGAFVGSTAVDGEPQGVLVVSYGNEAPGDARCQAGSDAIPDELAPGDSVRVVGRASSFAPASCDGIAPVPQIIADARCPFEPLETALPLEPVALPLDLATELAHGDDPELIRRWAGGLVRLDDVSALPNDTGDGAVRPYGVVALAETELEVHADIEYGDLTAAGPRDPSKGLDFPYPTAFRAITGLVYLDYCTYALAPRRRCDDFDPPSIGCPR